VESTNISRAKTGSIRKSEAETIHAADYREVEKRFKTTN
jgi:hypothetical protein